MVTLCAFHRNGQIKSEHIPSVLFDIPELRVLDLDGTRINNLPEENSCKLDELYLSNNYFLLIPKGKITNITKAAPKTEHYETVQLVNFPDDEQKDQSILKSTHFGCKVFFTK